MAIRGGAGDWRVSVDADAALRVFAQLETNLSTTATEKIAAKAAAEMHEAATQAFVRGVDPRTGVPWAPPSEGTLKGRGFRSLLRRSGTLLSDVRSGYKLTPRGARAFVNVEDRSTKVGMIQFFGGRGASKSAKARARRTKAAGTLSGWSLPARRFVGLSPRAVTEIFDYASRSLTSGAEG